MITNSCSEAQLQSTRLASTMPSPWRDNKNAPVAWGVAATGARLDFGVTPDQDAAIFLPV
jgi:hypothetical protein